ncbi:MAG: hypothetical protein IPM39_09500 [Chloroflexi bacterium]|nr:hypothetical protein [Chloroflexota bacterium]
MMTTIRFDDNRGGLAYPFLPADKAWQITAHSLSDEAALADIFQAPSPALRWVKDDKVLDLHVPGLDTADFLADAGLKLLLDKGGYVLSKRLSRIMRPFRYWGFFADSDITIEYNPSLDGRLWDGSGQVSRGFIQRLADALYPSTGSGQGLDERHRRELLAANRFEVTTLHSGGQDKGHVYVVDSLTVDFLFPTGSAKQELSLVDPSGDSGQASRTFIGLHPVHSADQMSLDIQSLINLYPFFQPEHLLAWTAMESSLFLTSIRDGRLDSILDRLTTANTAEALDSLADWHVGEYVASGGRLMWFAGMVKAAAGQHLKRLGSRASKLRLPIPGGRYYLFPAAVGDRDVPPGHVELDPAGATAWVNDADWLETIVDVLGGCDGDDAAWVFPFADASDGRQPRLLLWRSPNQVGEYVLLRPTAASHPIAWATPDGPLTCPVMSSHRLPPRIDHLATQYGTLAATDDTGETNLAYTIAAMTPTIRQAAANRGVLGSFCNVMMLCKAVYGRLPDQLPATLEAVIDGSVKSGLDLTPVRQWNEMALRRMAQHGLVNPHRLLPETLLDRLPDWLRQTAREARQQAAAAGQLHPHWLDTLSAAIEAHKAQYQAEVAALACEACPPLALFEQGRKWLAVGKELRQVYSRAIRQALAEGRGADDFFWSGDEAEDGDTAVAETLYQAARQASEAYLAQWPAAQRPFVLLGAAAYLYIHGPEAGAPVRDGLLWQLGEKHPSGPGREPGLAQTMLAALRQSGLLGEPVWTTAGAVLQYHEEPMARRAGVPVRINGTWLNLLNATGPKQYTRMGDVPSAMREQAKALIADYAATKFQGMALTTAVTDDNRVITRTPRGNLFGYVQRDHELAAIRHDQWRIAWATAVDGNVLAVLVPIADCGFRIAE